MPKITHPGVTGTAEVSDKTLPFWLRNGWSLADGEPEPAEPGVIVLARVKTDAEKYAREAGLTDERRWVYAQDADTVTGLAPEDYTLAVLPGFTEHRHHEDIVAALLEAGFHPSTVAPAVAEDPAGGQPTSAPNSEE